MPSHTSCKPLEGGAKFLVSVLPSNASQALLSSAGPGQPQSGLGGETGAAHVWSHSSAAVPFSHGLPWEV